MGSSYIVRIRNRVVGEICFIRAIAGRLASWKVEVEHDKRGAMYAHSLERSRNVAGLGDHAKRGLLLQKRTHPFANHSMIVNDHHTQRRLRRTLGAIARHSQTLAPTRSISHAP